MKKLIVIFAMIISIFSCKKDEEPVFREVTYSINGCNIKATYTNNMGDSIYLTMADSSKADAHRDNWVYFNINEKIQVGREAFLRVYAESDTNTSAYPTFVMSIMVDGKVLDGAIYSEKFPLNRFVTTEAARSVVVR